MNPGMFGELQAGCWGIQQEDVALDGGRRGKMVTLKMSTKIIVGLCAFQDF